MADTTSTWHDTVAAMTDPELRTAVSLGRKNIDELRHVIAVRGEGGVELGTLPAQLDDVWSNLRVAEAEQRRRAAAPGEVDS
jgi:hypothetical protein